MCVGGNLARKILYVVNEASFFVSHRYQLAVGAKARGYEVHVAAVGGASVKEIREQGFIFHDLPMSRSGKNPFKEIITFFAILKLLRNIKPRLVHLVTIKPVLYGGIAARLVGIHGVVAAISGLGYMFLSEGLKAGVARFLIKFIYGISLGKDNLRVIFQNSDDRDLFVRLGIVDNEKVELVRGSGVDLTQYRALPEPNGTIIVCMAARLLRDKGVREFVEAAKYLRDRGVDAKFQLVGDVDFGNPASITLEELEIWRKERHVEILGFCKNIAELFASAHIVVLPSYREGLPKVLVEAAACGRAVVTTNVPGCRDAIKAGSTGLLVPKQDSIALGLAVEKLVISPELRRKFGKAGRLLAEQDFDVNQIVQRHLDIYESLNR